MINNIKNKSVEKSVDSTQNFNDIKETDYKANIRQLIKDTCRSKKITAKKLCHGICTETYFSEFVNKGKRISEFMLDMFLQRLDIDMGNLENYLSLKEYEIFDIYDDIKYSIESGDIQKTVEKIEQIHNITKNMDKPCERFVLIMEANIMKLQNASFKEIYNKLKDAVKTTIPDFDNINSLDGLLLSHNELLFMVYCLSYKEKVCKNDDSIQNIYSEILKYIEKNTANDNIANRYLYPKLVCALAKKQICNNENISLLKNCNKAISFLHKCKRLHYIEELLKNKSIALDNIVNSESDIKKLNVYKNMKLKNEEERKLFINLFKKYNIVDEQYKWYPLDNNRELYLLNKIIKRRREMLGMSIEYLAKEAGVDIKTLKRIENNENDPFIPTVKDIFKILGILGESQVYDFDCNSYREYELEKKLSYLISSSKFEDAYEVLKNLKKSMYTLSKLNKQYLGHIETAILYETKRISNDEALSRYTNALMLTITKESIFSDREKYFTKREIKLIYNIAVIYEEKGENEEAIKWLRWCEKYYNSFSFDISNNIITYELVMSLYASVLGNVGKFDKSYEIAEKTIRESLKCGRSKFIADNMYNEAFNYKKRFEDDKGKIQPYEKNIYRDKLEKALAISKVTDNNRMINFLKIKLDEI